MMVTISLVAITAIAWWSFFLAFCTALGLGTIFAYHWFRYGSSQKIAWIASVAYTAGCIAPLMLMLSIAISHL